MKKAKAVAGLIVLFSSFAYAVADNSTGASIVAEHPGAPAAAAAISTNGEVHGITAGYKFLVTIPAGADCKWDTSELSSGIRLVGKFDRGGKQEFMLRAAASGPTPLNFVCKSTSDKSVVKTLAVTIVADSGQLKLRRSGGGCTTDADCGWREYCNIGTCWLQSDDTGGGCTSSFDCRFGDTCTDGSCTGPW